MLQKLTKAFVEKIGFEEKGQIFYRDSELKGFGLRVGATAKVYVAEAKLHGKTIRVTIARHNVITLDEARNQAKKILAEINIPMVSGYHGDDQALDVFYQQAEKIIAIRK